MITVNIWPSMESMIAVWNGLAPYVLVLAAAALALAAGIYLRRWLRWRAVERRRPKDPSPKRTMIMADAARRPVLEGQVLLPGDLVEIQVGWGDWGGVKWVRCSVKPNGGRWYLEMPDKMVVLAVGQLARWPRPSAPGARPLTRQDRETQQSQIYCRDMCGESCRGEFSCALFPRNYGAPNGVQHVHD